MSMENRLAKITEAERMLAEIASIQDALDVIDLAEAARVWAREVQLGISAINHATVIKLRAERKLADMVDEGQRAGQIAGQGRPRKPPESGGLSRAQLVELGVKDQRLSEARKIRDGLSDAELVEQGKQASADNRVMSRREVLRGAGMKMEDDRSPQTVQEIAVAETKRVIAACRVLGLHDPVRVGSHVRTLPESDQIRVKRQLEIAHDGLVELQEEITCPQTSPRDMQVLRLG